MPSHHSTQSLSPDGPDQNFPSGLLILRPSRGLERSAPAGDCATFTPAVTEGDGSVRVLGHHGSKQPTSNSEPTLHNGAGCLRNSHVAFGVLGDEGLVSRRYAEVHSITGHRCGVCREIADLYSEWSSAIR